LLMMSALFAIVNRVFCFDQYSHHSRDNNALKHLHHQQIDRVSLDRKAGGTIVRKPGVSLLRKIGVSFAGISRFSALSSNDSVLYVISSTGILISDTFYLLQYNLAAANILASCDTLDTFNYPINPGGLLLGPDNKIYMTCSYGDIQ
jgi:hypothetical protein